MENEDKQGKIAQQYQGYDRINGPTVIQPSETAAQGSQPTQPTVVVSQLEPANAGQPNNIQEPAPTQATPSTRNDTFPVGMSASQLGLDESRSHMHIGWRRLIKNGIYPIAMLLVVAGSLLFWKYYIDGTATKTYTAGNYTYSYTFFRQAKFEHFPNGMQGYMLGQAEASAFIGPTVDNPEYCAELGVAYTQAFTVQMYGSAHNVCKAHDNLNNQIYAVNFSTLNKNFEFVIDYPVSQNAKVFPKLKSIFESVKVSR
jgi:hypothetical protein